MAQNISFPLYPSQLKNDLEAKKLKYQCLPAICALLNNPDGGKLFLDSEDGTEFESQSSVSLFIHNLVSLVKDQFRLSATLHFSLYSTSSLQLVFKVDARPPSSWFSVASNLYLPSDRQVLEALPAADLEVIHEILNETRKPNGSLPPEANPHNWSFVEGQSLPNLEECKQVEFKMLKSKKVEDTTLAKRIFKRKFASYVSAFANYHGGRIFYGINDDGVVKGEIFDSETKLTQEELTDEVAKKIASPMIWPKKCEKGKHWDIHFEEVIGGDGRVVPSTFVIIISVAPCPGGVFTEEPESYVLVEGNVRKMTFEDWKDEYLSKYNELTNRFKQQLRYFRKKRDLESFTKASDEALKIAHGMEIILQKEKAAATAAGDFEEAFQ